MDRLNKIVRYIFSSPFAMLYLFIVLLFSDGMFYYITNVNVFYILSAIVLCNVLPLLLIEKLFVNQKSFYYILSSIFIVFSAYIISNFIFYVYVSIVYISFLWILSARVFLKNLDLQIAMYSSVISFLYYTLYVGVVDSSISIMILFVLLGFMGMINLKENKSNLFQICYSFIIGVGCIYLSILLLII